MLAPLHPVCSLEFLHKGWTSTTSLNLEIKLFFREREVKQGEKWINQLSIEVR